MRDGGGRPAAGRPALPAEQQTGPHVDGDDRPAVHRDVHEPEDESRTRRPRPADPNVRARRTARAGRRLSSPTAAPTDAARPSAVACIGNPGKRETDQRHSSDAGAGDEHPRPSVGDRIDAVPARRRRRRRRRAARANDHVATPRSASAARASPSTIGSRSRRARDARRRSSLHLERHGRQQARVERAVVLRDELRLQQMLSRRSASSASA